MRPSEVAHGPARYVNEYDYDAVLSRAVSAEARLERAYREIRLVRRWKLVAEYADVAGVPVFTGAGVAEDEGGDWVRYEDLPRETSDEN
jgi:hypothetical protein